MSALGNPYTISAKPETRNPIMYYTEAARAMVKLGQAPVENIKAVNYLVVGVTPTPSAGDIADTVRERVAEARISFEPDPELQGIMDNRQALSRIDDSSALKEWGWRSEYSLARIIDEVLSELRQSPERYA